MNKPTFSYITPDWPAPSNVVALTTMRERGVSKKPFDHFNLADHVGDDPVSVNSCRSSLLDECEGLHSVQWLEQTHSTSVVIAGDTLRPRADACVSQQQGVACAVMTADCLPLLFYSQSNGMIAACHAGWRGLAAGIINNTVAQMNSPADDVLVWMGPAISQTNFEVGSEVRQAFMNAVSFNNSPTVVSAFVENSLRADYYFADLYQLARICLLALGIDKVYGGDLCTYAHADRFYSYRRDGNTGRMASLIYKK